MKKLILILVVLLLGGGAAWWFLLREDPAEAETETTAEAAAPSFFDLPPFTVTAVRDSDVQRIIQIDLALELDGAAVGAMETGLPHLIDAFVTELYGLLSHRQMEERQYDLAIVKRRLQGVADRTLGEGQVLAVLVQGIALAPVR